MRSFVLIAAALPANGMRVSIESDSLDVEAGNATSSQPFWGCGLLGKLPGISSAGTMTGDIARMVEGLKKTSPYNKVHFWNWNLAPMNPKDGSMEYLTKDFLFMPEQWGVETVNDDWIRQANSVGFLDSEGGYSPATMADIFLGANEPDIYGSCMGSMMGACRAPCTTGEVLAGDCPTAHLLQDQGSARPNSKGHCDCWSDSHATGCGYWPVPGVDHPQPLPTCWDNPQCIEVQMAKWRGTAKILAGKGYKYATTPLVAVNMEYIRKFLHKACDTCHELSCGCPTHIGWHFYANDCLSGGKEKGYSDFKRKLAANVQIMEEFPFIQGSIVNEVGMLNCAMDTPDAICEPNGPDQKYPAMGQPNHDCPSTAELPNGFASFIEDLMEMVAEAKTSDGRRAVTAFTWFNQDMAGGTYNLRLFNDDGTLNAAGEAYIKSCQAWASEVPMHRLAVPRPPAAQAPRRAAAESKVVISSAPKVGAPAECPNGNGAMCAGDQCCPGDIPCPTANPGFKCR